MISSGSRCCAGRKARSTVATRRGVTSTSLQPTKASFDASFDMSYGNFNDVMTHAMVNVPVSDTLAIRALSMEHRTDGYFKHGGLHHPELRRH